MKTLQINCPDGHEIDQEKSDLSKGIIEFKEVKSKKITYKDVTEALFGNRESYYINTKGSVVSTDRLFKESCIDSNNSTTSEQLESILALNKLCNVARYLNRDWIPDWNTGEDKHYFYIEKDEIKVSVAYWNKSSSVYFSSGKLALQAIEILGEEEIKKALTLNH
jgi:hypothetical protein